MGGLEIINYYYVATAVLWDDRLKLDIDQLIQLYASFNNYDSA